MRLVQLSRKLGVTQSEIIDFLSKNGIQGIEGSNAKVDDHAISIIMEHFGEINDTETADTDQPQIAPPAQEPVTADQAKEEETENEEKEIISTPELKEVKEEDANEDEENLEAEEPEQQEQPTSTDVAPEVEVIRAKKIKLEGIKVLGKIDLPEPVKKEPDEPQENSVTERKPRHKRNERDKNGRKPYRKPKREETYEQKQKRQEREALRKKKEREKKLKKKKKAYYEKQIKSDLRHQKPSVKPKKKKKKEPIDIPVQKKEVIYHKNPIKRLWAWLNGRYD